MRSRIAADRLRDLQRITDAALAYLPLEALLDELLARVVDILGVDTSAVLLLEDDDTTLVARAAKGLEEEVERGVRIPVGRGFAGRIAATREPVHVLNLDETEIVNPILRERGLRSLLGVPLLVEGSVLGVLHVGTQPDAAPSRAARGLARRPLPARRGGAARRRLVRRLRAEIQPTVDDALAAIES